jgi:DNA repair exonuclease SbcCD ATPase subunit
LLKQQDRLKHLETLIGKVSADTNSTRQILNIVQSDLITQSDTLRELDQHWQGILATYQPHHSPETPTAEDCLATVAPEECVGSPSAPSASSPNSAFDKPLAALALESERLERELQQGLSEVQNGLMGQDERFTELRSAFQNQLHGQQERLAELETALDQLRGIPTAAPDLNPLRDTLAAQAEALRELRETAQHQAATLTQTLELQQSDVRETSATVEDLQREFGELRQTLARLNATIEQQHQRAEAGHQQELDLRREQASLQHTLTSLEERLSNQALAFSGHFEQFQTLASDIRNLQQQISTLEAAPRRLSALEEDLVGSQQSIVRVQDAVRQLQEDSQQAGEVLQQIDPGAFVGDLEARLGEQHLQVSQLHEEIEVIRGDAKATQEKVITMATNVAKRIFEFQNQLTATEAAHADRLQEAEQKLIQLQAALETLETQHKGRRWLNMPAMFSHLLLTVGATFLGILATVIWTTT